MNHRIALITSTEKSSDNRIYCFLAKTLCKNGWRVEVINPHFEGIDNDKIRFRRVALPTLSVLRMKNSHKLMLSALKESRADVVILHDAELLLMLPKLKSQMVIQVIFDAYQKTCEPKSFMRKIADIAENVIIANKLEYVDAIITNDISAVDRISEKFERTSNIIANENDADLLLSLCDELEQAKKYSGGI